VSEKPRVCAQIESDLLASAIREAEPDTIRQVQRHIERCQPCRDEYREYQAIDGAVAALRDRLPAAGAVAASRERIESRLLDLRNRLLTYRIFSSPVGNLLIARSDHGVALVEYLGRAAEIGASRLSRFAGIEALEDGDDVEALYRELLDYLDGRRTRLEWPLDFRLVRSDFHRAVLGATAAIPYGAVIPYTGLARNIGRPRAVRAVAQALRWNPLPIVVPCHRVIGLSGALTGYAGGETTHKHKLLAVEGIPMVRTRDDFRVDRDAVYVQMPGDAEYCLPSCPSSEDLRTRAPMLFGSREPAESLGFRPCTTCRPDLHPIARPRGPA
jgi:methylated-DNA-[protein]-cysteine S-methyltransferase